MLFMYLWFYTFMLAILWWFFIIAKIHAYKFKNFSTNIEKVTKTLLIFLISLSLIWYIVIIFSFSWENAEIKIDNNTYKEIDY